jgi:hypothetical protein
MIPEIVKCQATIIQVDCHLRTVYEMIPIDTIETEVATLVMIMTEIVTTGMTEKGNVIIVTNEKETVIDSIVTLTANTMIATMTTYQIVIAIGTEKDHRAIWIMIDTNDGAAVNVVVKDDVIVHETVVVQVVDVTTIEEEIVIESVTETVVH